MRQAAVAGVDPLRFDAMTVGEVLVCIEAYHERERQTLISRISSILRAFAKNGQAFKGLIDRGPSTREQVSAFANTIGKAKGSEGKKPMQTRSIKELARRWFWQDLE